MSNMTSCRWSATAICFGFALARTLCVHAATAPRTFCNPLDIDYGPVVHSGVTVRHGADPVIVLFNDRYYLFSTRDKPGYRVSDDLLSWKFIPFDPSVALLGYSHTYTAAAVAVIDGWMYFTELAAKGK